MPRPGLTIPRATGTCRSLPSLPVVIAAIGVTGCRKGDGGNDAGRNGMDLDHRPSLSWI